MTNLSYRIANPSDVPKIVELVNSAYRGQASREGWTTEADLLDGQRTDGDAILEIINKLENVLLLCFSESDLLGSVQLEKQASNCYLGMFTVKPKLQSQGIGKEFIAAAESFARNQWQCLTVSMTVIVQRLELIAWYERRGYQKTGETSPFPYGNERYGIPKRPDLRMIVLKKEL